MNTKVFNKPKIFDGECLFLYCLSFLGYVLDYISLNLQPRKVIYLWCWLTNCQKSRMHAFSNSFPYELFAWASKFSEMV